jgi:hypothetical protein
MEANNVLSAEPLDPVLATIIAVTLGVLIYVGPIASALTSVFSKNWVIVLGTCLLSAAGFLIAAVPFQGDDLLALFAGSAIQVGGLLLAIGGVQSRRRWAAVWHAFEELSASVHAPFKGTQTFLAIELEMNTTDIYRQAIKRTFSQLYSVPPSTVDVAWSNEGETIVVKCAGKTFIHLILSDSNDDAPQFLSINHPAGRPAPLR